MSAIDPDLSGRAARAAHLLAVAERDGVSARVLGGAAIQMLCPSARPPEGRWARGLADIDLATVGRERGRLDALVVAQGFRPDEPFNRMNSSVRLRYLDEDGAHLDVFIDELRLCHVVSWRKTLDLAPWTLPLPELLLTKLQIVRVEDKDLGDLAALLTDQWQALEASAARLEQLVAGDWGLWRTGQMTLQRLVQLDDELVRERAAIMLSRWESVRFTTKARLRAAIGDRVQWYEEPEEV